MFTAILRPGHHKARHSDISFIFKSFKIPALIAVRADDAWARYDCFLHLQKGREIPLPRFVAVYGRVPMFYYILHIYLIHLLAMISSELFTNVDWRNWLLRQPLWFNDDLKGYGFSLAIVYLVWFGVVLALYPLCKKYDHYKQTNKQKWWLSYL